MLLNNKKKSLESSWYLRFNKYYGDTTNICFFIFNMDKLNVDSTSNIIRLHSIFGFDKAFHSSILFFNTMLNVLFVGNNLLLICKYNDLYKILEQLKQSKDIDNVLSLSVANQFVNIANFFYIYKQDMPDFTTLLLNLYFCIVYIIIVMLRNFILAFRKFKC